MGFLFQSKEMKKIKREVPGDYMPKTRPSFFRYLLTRSPEKRFEIIERLKGENKE